MGLITTSLISFIIIAVNVGLKSNFMIIWFRSWCLSYIIAVLAMLFIAPRVQLFVDTILYKSQIINNNKKASV